MERWWHDTSVRCFAYQDLIQCSGTTLNILLYFMLCGEPGGGLVYRGLCELDEGTLGMGNLSLKRLHGGGLGEGSLTREPER